jgi:hypothetical protein
MSAWIWHNLAWLCSTVILLVNLVLILMIGEVNRRVFKAQNEINRLTEGRLRHTHERLLLLEALLEVPKP